MKLASFDALVRALDLVVQLDPENVERAYAALGGLGSSPNRSISIASIGMHW
jgi:hypothetical protein